ncbi:hypothetical protein L596_015269 [Steinernema carpocapsae]|nr:hypothetical protein L596_015269 [Steinernema carpocapsae]
MSSSKLFLLILLLHFVISVFGDGFVEEVACSADALTVVLNRSDPDITRWLSNSKSQPMVFVQGHRSHAKCGAPLKIEGGKLSYNLTIPYGPDCAVLLADLEPSYRTAETTIALEDVADTDPRKSIRVNHVFCLYQRSVQTIRFNDFFRSSEPAASVGGRPKAKVEMLFKSMDGHDLRTAKIGDMVQFYVALSPDNAYRGISPKECKFSDREDMLSPDAKHLTFVQSSCPVDQLGELMEPLGNINDEIYFSKFRTFRFGNQSTIFAHCTVQVCLDSSECTKKCYNRVKNSNLTTEALHRHRRSPRNAFDERDLAPVDQVKITRGIDILGAEEYKQVALSSSSVEQCLLSPDAITRPIGILIAVLSVVAAVSLVFVFILTRKLRAERKLTDVACYYGAPYGSAYPSVPAPLARHYSTASLHYYDKNWPNQTVDRA